MDETPDVPRGSDGDWGGEQDDPSAMGSLSGESSSAVEDPGDDEDVEDEAPPRRGVLGGGRLAAVGVVAVVLVVGGIVAFALHSGDGEDTASPSSEEAGSSPADAAFEYAECMRDHGIEDYPDPEVFEDGGFAIGPPESATPEELEPAEEECQPILEAGEEQLTPEQVAERQDQWLAMAQCVRARGWDFPDPQVDENGHITIDYWLAPGEPPPQFDQDALECEEESGLADPPDGGDGGSSSSGDGGE